MNDFWTKVLQFCHDITGQIGPKLIENCGKIKPTNKEDGTLVTEADKWADDEIRKAISLEFPNHGVLTEETKHIFPENDWCWVIDPIDGTTNFSRGIPIWGISFGLLYKGTPVFGYVDFPGVQQSFYGYWYGDSGLTGPTGAYLNGEQIYTSDETPSKSHLFNLCARSLDIMKNPFPCKIRMIGASTYNMLLVACGASLGGVEATPKIWDIAASWAILQGAGGEFVSLRDEPIFPLKVGKDYGSYPYPSLTVSKKEWISLFKPLVQFIGERVVNKS